MSSPLDGVTLPRHRILDTALRTMISASARYAHRSRPVRQDGFVEVNGSRLYYEMRGTDLSLRETPVILVHARSFDHRSWDGQFKVVSKFLTTYRYDLRGHGLSDPITGPFGLHNDLIGFMDARGIDKAHLVGQSLGGNIVTEIAASHPDRIAKLILIDSGINGFAYTNPNVLQEIRAYLELLRAEEREATLEALVIDSSLSLMKEIRRTRAEIGALLLHPQYEVRPPTYSRLGLITAPTLVMIGEFLQQEFQAAADALQSGIQDSRKVVIPGVGQMSTLDEPLEVTWEILEFLLEGQHRP